MIRLVHSWRPLLAWTLLPSFAAAAGDWPQWRGPHRDGSWEETGILESLPARGLTVRWRFPVHRGFSSPVVAQGRVYVTDTELLQPRIVEHVDCLEEATGKQLWSFATEETSYPDWIFQSGQERGSSSSGRSSP